MQLDPYKHAVHVAMVLLNPSKASGLDDDPTVRKSVGFASRMQPLPDLVELKAPLAPGAEPARADTEYRYRLWRPAGPGRLDIVNMFGWRATDPRDLAAAHALGHDVVGPDNDRHIAEVVAQADLVVVGWGSLSGRRWALPRAAACLELIRLGGKQPFALATTKDGQPGHPLMLPYSSGWRPYHPPWDRPGAR
jgi:hypothetical protein